MKHEIRPAHLAESDANITAFSDEYDLGECSTSLEQNVLLTPVPAHEGNGIVRVFNPRS